MDMVGQGYYTADGTYGPAEFLLKRVPGKDGSYLMMSQFRYVDVDGDTSEEWTIPDEPTREFETDLASIPSLAGWLVPKDGRHTPAALVHDAMILSPGETHCYQGRKVEAEEADRIFRRGMQFLGVKFWRRWMIWSAVSLLTLWRSAGDSALGRLLNRLRMVVGLLAFCIIGLFLLPDVLDFPELTNYPFLPASVPLLRNIARWDPVKWLWYIEEGSFVEQLARFALVMAIATALYTVAWGRRWQFGLFAGVTLSLIAFPMAVGAVSYGIYAAIEFLISLVLLVTHRKGRDKGRVPASELAQKITGEKGAPTQQGAPKVQPGAAEE